MTLHGGMDWDQGLNGLKLACSSHINVRKIFTIEGNKAEIAAPPNPNLVNLSIRLNRQIWGSEFQY